MVEKQSDSSLIHPIFGRCCQRGKVSLPPMRIPPEPLYSLLSMQLDFDPNYVLPAIQHEHSRNYLNNIQKYNAAFAFLSLGVKIDERITGAGGGPYAFRIHGKLSHLHGALLPEAGHDISYAQMYIHDTQEALAHAHQQQVACNQGTTPEIMLELQDMMHANNPYIPMYRTAHEILLALPVAQHNVECRIHLDESADQRHYNLPQADQIAAILPGDGENARLVSHI
ncbi:hypothetical protein BS47DRAFT_1299019 [Hydnum rufescens UP504]|uniref:Helitron helicase-like domain-containing protein n=1 Tax=Hydnum rufescens UP504 TaxID=1448309 RepID=A0A9P6ASW2_9AGAM|nr:hypothetical protein BS47DRAFT_1299019 [Hydnum rufescens UP504]